MSIEPLAEDYPVGERPEVPPAGAVDASSPALSSAGRSSDQHTICTMVTEIDGLNAELADQGRHIEAMNRERSELYRLVDGLRTDRRDALDARDNALIERNQARTERDELDRLLGLSNEVLAEVDKGYAELNAKLDIALAQRDTANAKMFGSLA